MHFNFKSNYLLIMTDQDILVKLRNDSGKNGQINHLIPV